MPIFFFLLFPLILLTDYLLFVVCILINKLQKKEMFIFVTKVTIKFNSIYTTDRVCPFGGSPEKKKKNKTI